MLASVSPRRKLWEKALRAFGKPQSSDPLLRQNEDYFSHFDQDKPLTEYEFTVLDTELTGFSPRSDEIVSVGAVRIRNFCITADTFYSLVAPKIPVPKASTLIHRITPEQLENAPRLRNILPRLVRFCDKSLIVGHNVGLDMSFLNRAAVDILGGRLNTPCLDTMRLAQVYQQELWENYYDRFDSNVSYNLGYLSRKYGLPCFDQHNALYDSMQTAYLFLFLVKKLHSGGLETLRDLYMAGRSWRRYL